MEYKLDWQSLEHIGGTLFGDNEDVLADGPWSSTP